MRPYAIRRQIDPNATRADVDAGAIFTLMHMANLASDPEKAWPPPIPIIEWVRTYWHEGSGWGTCLYVAPSADDIEQFHVRCDIQYAEFHPIVELSSSERVDPETGMTRLDPDYARFTVETRLPDGVAATDHLFGDVEQLLERTAGPRFEGAAEEISWVRTYWDEERRIALSLYAAPTQETVAAVEAVARDSETVVRPITEIYPHEYLVD